MYNIDFLLHIHTHTHANIQQTLVPLAENQVHAPIPDIPLHTYQHGTHIQILTCTIKDTQVHALKCPNTLRQLHISLWCTVTKLPHSYTNKQIHTLANAHLTHISRTTSIHRHLQGWWYTLKQPPRHWKIHLCTDTLRCSLITDTCSHNSPVRDLHSYNCTQNIEPQWHSQQTGRFTLTLRHGHTSLSALKHTRLTYFAGQRNPNVPPSSFLFFSFSPLSSTDEYWRSIMWHTLPQARGTQWPVKPSPCPWGNKYENR